MGNIIYTTAGARSESALDRERPVVYRATRRFSDGGEPGRPSDSSLFPKEVSRVLDHIRGKVHLTKYKNQCRNMHVYTSDSETIDGLGRICYLEYDGEKGQTAVSEFGHTRNSGYSALYRELTRRMDAAGFISEDRRYALKQDQIPAFVDLVNQLIEDKESGELELNAVDEIDTMAFGINNESVRYYYFKAYWVKKQALPSADSCTKSPLYDVKNEEIEHLYKDMEAAIRAIALFCVNSHDLQAIKQIGGVLDGIRAKLAMVDEMNQARINMLEDLKRL